MTKVRLLNFYIFLSICITIGFIDSCKNGKHVLKYPERVLIDMDEPTLGNVDIDIEEVIPLETTQTSLVGDILNLKVFNDRYYIVDYIHSQTVFAFNKQGKFIKKLENGKGPGEVIRPIAFTFNHFDSTIIVHDPFVEANLIYDTMLKFIRSTKLINHSVLGLHEISRDTFLLYEHNEVPKSNFEKRLSMYSLYFNNSNKSLSLDIFQNLNKTATSIISNVSIFRDTILFICPFSYTVYELKQGCLPIVRYQLEFGTYSFTSEQLESLPSKDLLYLAAKGQKVGSIESIFNTKDFFVIRPIITQKPVYVFKSKRSNKVIFINRFFSSKLPECNIYDSFYDNRFIATVEPDEFNKFKKTSGRFKEINVESSDNPILVIFKVTEKL